MAYPQFTPEELETEEWREAPLRYSKITAKSETRYEVSNLGRMRSVTIHMLKPNAAAIYPHVALYLRGQLKRTTPNIHRIVAEVFIGPPPDDKPFVNHLDANKHNTRASNLEYTSSQGNTDHAVGMGLIRRGEQLTHLSKLTEAAVRAIKNHIAKEPSFHKGLAGIARQLNVDRTTICAIKSGKTWTHVKADLATPSPFPQPRSYNGEHNPSAKLSKEQVLNIRKLHATGEYELQELADTFCIGKSQIWRIVKRQSWKHVD